MILYHGSTTYISDKYLTPSVSFDFKPLVYATEDECYALVRCGKFNIRDIAIKEDYIDENHIFTLIELRKNAFKDIFDTSGYLYEVDRSYFEKKEQEYISENKVPILNSYRINNVWKAMNDINDEFDNKKYLFVPYELSDMYFKSTGCNKEKYLERRKERIKKLLSKKGISYDR